MKRFRRLGAAVAVGLSCISALTTVASAQARPTDKPTSKSVGVTKIPGDTARPLPVDPKVRVGTLPNGLRYYIRQNKKPEKRAELRLVVNAGSVLEDDDQRGLAHFAEHMAFNGTKNFKKNELVDYLEGIGMRFGPDLNAYTSFDETVYELLVPTDTAKVFEKGFTILQDWANGQTFEPDQVKKERGVVVEEWRLGQGAGSRLRDKQLPVIFKDSRYAQRLPIGTRESLESFPDSSLKRFYRDWYRPDLQAVVAVGDFDPARVEQLIKRNFSSIPKRTSPRKRTLFPVPDHDSTLFAIATDKETTQSNVAVYYKQPTHRQRTIGDYRQSIVQALYNDMLNQRLYEITQKPDAPFISGSSSKGSLLRTKDVYVLGALVKDGGVARGLEALLVEAERVDKYGFTQGELDRVKKDMLRGMEQAYAEREKSNSGGYAAEYARAYLEAEPIPGIEYEYELYKRFIPEITLAELNKLGREWITDKNRVITVSAPEKEGLAVPTATELLSVFAKVKQQQIVAYADSLADAPLVPNAPTAGTIVSTRSIPKIGVTEWKLSNGVRVLLKPTDFQADQILVSSYSPGGSSLASDADYLPATMSDDVVAYGGVGTFNLIDLQKMLSGKAATASPSVGSMEEGISGRASPKDAETMFQLMYLYFTAPRSDSTAFVSLQQRLRGLLENRSASPEAAYEDTIQVTLAQHHVRARPFTTKLLDEMDLRKSFDFYRDRFADASDFTFAIVGNFELDAIKPLVLQYLGGLPSLGRKEKGRDVGIRPPTGVVERTVKRGVEPKAQTRITFTGPGEFNRANVYALSSLADVMRIRLREALREDMGGTYGVDVSAGLSRDPRQEYSVTVSFGSAPDRLEELTQAAFRLIDSLKTTGPTASDLAKVKEMQRRSRETSLKQNGFWLGQILSYDRNGWNMDDIVGYDALVDSLNAEMVRNAAQKYLPKDNYVRVSLVPEK
jgi:zinc protease